MLQGTRSQTSYPPILPEQVCSHKKVPREKHKVHLRCGTGKRVSATPCSRMPFVRLAEWIDLRTQAQQNQDQAVSVQDQISPDRKDSIYYPTTWKKAEQKL